MDFFKIMNIYNYEHNINNIINEYVKEIERGDLYNLRDELLKKYNNKWYDISYYQKLSESFIREFKDYVYWLGISKYQKLSESFIREFKDYVDWYGISRKQNLSEPF